MPYSPDADGFCRSFDFFRSISSTSALAGCRHQQAAHIILKVVDLPALFSRAGQKSRRAAHEINMVRGQQIAKFFVSSRASITVSAGSAFNRMCRIEPSGDLRFPARRYDR